MSKTLNVAIVGAGVTGLTTGLVLLESNKNIKLTIFSDEFTPNTSSDTSTGFWHPFCFSENDCVPKENIL